MIDMNKKYTYNGNPVRIYADGSDTKYGNLHCAILETCGYWVIASLVESDLVEAWEPKKGEWCFFWDEEYSFLAISKLKQFKFNNENYKEYETLTGATYSHVAPFTGTLPKEFKG